MQYHDYISLVLETEVSCHSKLIAFTLLHYRNKQSGDCYPSLDTLSAAASMSRNTVIKSINELKDAGLVTIEKKRPKNARFTSNYYVFPVHSASGEPSNDRSNDRSNDSSRDELKHSKHSKHSKEGEAVSKKKPNKGTRLPEGWVVSDELKSWASSIGIAKSKIDWETDKFRDYWHAQAGQRGVKLNWDLTWKNWIRRVHEDKKAKSPQPESGAMDLTAFRNIMAD